MKGPAIYFARIDRKTSTGRDLMAANLKRRAAKLRECLT